MRHVRMLWVILAVGFSIAACTDSTSSSPPPSVEPSTPSSAPPTVEPDRPRLRGTPAPRWPLEDLLGTWSLSSTLTLSPDGTYEIVSSHGVDSGRWVYFFDAEVLRLTTRDGSDMCEPSERTRMSIEVVEETDGSGARLVLDRLREDCFLRGHLGTTYQTPSLNDDLSGTWSSEASITIETVSYKIETPDGTDTGVFDYIEPDWTLYLETTGGELCPGGSQTSLRAIHTRYASGGATVEFAVLEGGDCEILEGLAGEYID